MKKEEICSWILGNFDDVVMKESYDEIAFFYNKDEALINGVYFLTIKESNGPNDKASQLDRSGVYRVSWQLSKKVFAEKFGQKPARPAKGASIDTTFSLDKLDTHLPHAVYGWMCWSMILSPSKATFSRLEPTIWEAYSASQDKFAMKTSHRSKGK
ncbi:MAG: hypothetical protein HRU19_22550 [Pseudobacteriovorax sp.]|nr:hypothetical protein [Pseudobacteriovorax sp.]